MNDNRQSSYAIDGSSMRRREWVAPLVRNSAVGEPLRFLIRTPCRPRPQSGKCEPHIDTQYGIVKDARRGQLRSD
jgi:hypothetical protein